MSGAARKFFLFAGIAAALFALWLAAYAVLMYREVASLADPSRSIQIQVLDWNRKPRAFWVGPRNPHYMPWKQISANVKWAVILSEDGKFYRHHGVDYEALKSAFRRNIEVGRYVRGGSTITQQLAKNLFLSREKSLVRKFKELIIALIMEMKLSKSRILELYLNVVECGPMVYGVPHAAWFYFDKSAASLNGLEGALIASLLPGPRIYDPYRNLGRVEERAKRLLNRMFEAGVVGEGEYARLKSANMMIGLERKIGIREHEMERTGFGSVSGVSGAVFAPRSSVRNALY